MPSDLAAVAPPEAFAAFTPKRALDLGLTLGPIGLGPWLYIAEDEVWRATLTPDGPATMHLLRLRGEMRVEAWGPGAAWAVGNAPALCGEDDDDSGFKPDLPLLRRLHRQAAGLRIPKTRAVFEALVPAVIGQKVTGAEAKHSYLALVRALGTPAPAQPRMIVPPGAGTLSATPYFVFHKFGIERRRAETIIRAARSAKRLEETVGMDPISARARLEAFPGIGPWTSATVALTALGDADAVPVGDYNLPHAVGYALEGTVRSTDERMLELLEPYRGHRGRVIRLLLLAGHSRAPRFGPRMPQRDIAST